MTPLFSPVAPWANRLLLLTGLMCLPIAGLVVRETYLHQCFEREIMQAKQRLDSRHRILHQFQEAQLRRQRQTHQLAMLPPVIGILNSIGGELSQDIALLSIDINATNHEARITLNAKNLSTLLAFTERLQKLSANIVLENHRPTASGGIGWPLSASLIVRFRTGEWHVSGK